MIIFAAICDDEVRICAELETALVEIFDRQNIKYEIDVYSSGDELCAHLENGLHYNIIFLDIEFARNSLSGVEVGRILRETHHNDLTSIVYISWEMQYSMQLFDIRPLNFLIKPLDYKKVEQTVITHLRIAGIGEKEFVYKVGHDTHKVLIQDIIYIESDRRKLTLHLANGRKSSFYGVLKEIYQKQFRRCDFIFIHGSCIVNYDYIAVAKYDEMALIDGITFLSISQPKRKEVRERYYEIMERRGI